MMGRTVDENGSSRGLGADWAERQRVMGAFASGLWDRRTDLVGVRAFGATGINRRRHVEIRRSRLHRCVQIGQAGD